jgi:hypothetical protein
VTRRVSFVVGVDPGLSGAFAVLDPAAPFGTPLCPALVHVGDFPVLSGKSSSGRTRTYLDMHALLSEFRNWAPYGDAVSVAVEQVSAMPKQGVSSTFRFGEAFGQVQGLMTAMGWSITRVEPARWKTDLRLRAGKDDARRRCIELWPAQAQLFARAKDHGRADAALIAMWLLTRRPVVS